MKNLYSFIRQCAICIRHVWLVIAALLFLIFLGSAAISFVEEMSLGKAIYFAFITALAVGYGDITPATVTGKIVSVLIGFVGLVLFGVIIGVSTRAILVIMHMSEFDEGETGD